MNGAFAGTWSIQPHGGEVLHYDKDWVASPQGRPLSLSLPFTPGNTPHRGIAVRAYFENLLPDSKDIRERVARRYKTGSTDAFDLLRSEEHTSELQVTNAHLVCRLLLEQKKK